MDGNQVFRDHVTNQAFNLSLSKNMVYWLALTKLNLMDYSGSRFMQHMQGLKRRGLIEWRPDPKSKEGHVTGPFMTEAGEHVLSLCVIAGLVDLKEIAGNDLLDTRRKESQS